LPDDNTCPECRTTVNTAEEAINRYSMSQGDGNLWIGKDDIPSLIECIQELIDEAKGNGRAEVLKECLFKPKFHPVIFWLIAIAGFLEVCNLITEILK
jgi:hypothetical protein